MKTQTTVHIRTPGVAYRTFLGIQVVFNTVLNHFSFLGTLVDNVLVLQFEGVTVLWFSIKSITP